MKHLFSVLFAFLCLATGCSKKSADPAPDNTPTVASQTALLTAGRWRLTAYTISGGQANAAPFDYIAKRSLTNNTLFESTRGDDFVRFSTDGTWVQDEGATRANSFPQIRFQGTWSFDLPNQALRLSGMRFVFNANQRPLTSPTPLDLVELSNQRLVVVYNDFETAPGVIGGISTKETLTFESF
ncbi:hypothetical protein [Hymenobacter sp.]|uniref:hypothetical protein n=1 Tax=Hymenobacter sp. TaxID=1898978 RepID=UPI00286B3265|nr:hypothetical protein [Hymenobacter sp.]